MQIIHHQKESQSQIGIYIEIQRWATKALEQKKINLHQSDGERKDPLIILNIQAHRSGMAWACMAASGMDLLIFIDDVPHDSRTKWEVVYLQMNTSNLIGRNFNMKQYNDPKQAANAKQMTKPEPNWACSSPPFSNKETEI